MRIPLSWLAEYVDLAPGATPETVMAELVKVGLEEEGSHSFQVAGPIVVGQVLDFQEEPQSNGKTIRWCQVRVAGEGDRAADGGDDVRGIVCGARNFEVGDKVVVCLPGSVLPGDFQISARTTYGHTSDGMIASGRELNLSDDHEGILRLASLGLDPKIGIDAIELLGLDDQAAEINVLPDRGYCMSIRGVAREYSHATEANFRDPVGNVHPLPGEGFSLVINDEAPIRSRKTSQSFVLRSVTGIDATVPTPVWMRSRLKLAGMRSISLPVDITNYVMLELGQPVHAYDLDKITGGFEIRRAKAGEKLKTLDGQVRDLHPEDLLITDDSGPIGLAGVMGGFSTEVSESTSSVLIEAAHFDSVSIGRSARRHKLFSEASKRYERGVDPKVGEFAAARVVQLLEVLAGGKASTIGATYSNVDAPEPIALPAGFASELSGISMDTSEIEKVLKDIGAEFEVSDGIYYVTAPSWRPDLRHKNDLVEEIARILGYDRIPSRLPVAPPGRGLNRQQVFRRTLVNSLAASGFTEVLNYPFVSEAENGFFTESISVKLANPLQEESGWLRQSLLPGLIRTAQRNISRGLTDLAIFEDGLVFTGSNQKEVSFPDTSSRPSEIELEKLNASIPNQPRFIAGILVGNRVANMPGVKQSSFGAADALFASRIIASSVGLDIEVKQSTSKGYHPGRSAELLVGEKVVGHAGELDPVLAKENGLPRQVGAFEINLDLLFELAPHQIQAKPIGTYPAATQDLSLVVAIDVPAANVLKSVREGCGELLEEIHLTDDYRGENVPPGTKSLTFSLRFRAFDRTLTQIEATEARDRGVANAKRLFQAEIRA